MPQFNDSLSQSRVDELRAREEEHLIQTLAHQHGYQYLNLRGITIDPEALELIDESTAREGEMVVFERNFKKLTVAIRNPNNETALTAIKHLKENGYSISVVMTARNSLEHAWSRYHDEKKTTAAVKGVLDINPDQIAKLAQSLKRIDDVVQHIKTIRTANTARRVSETLETIFAGALRLNASDIHIEPEEGGVRLRYRLDGVLQDIVDLERRIYEQLISRLKLLSGLKLNVRDEAQDGRFTFSLGERDVEVRSSAIPGASGETMVMRLLDPSVSQFEMGQLGLNSALQKALLNELKKPNGMIVTTGPTGSGKTTALYSFLKHVYSEGVKIITIEDPVEYKLDGIVQTQVGDDYTFESGLRAILRQDPDIILVGEIRDKEVARTALHAAQTGHLVFTTLHTNSAIGAIPRLIDLKIDPRVMGNAINIIVGQRLVRVLCPHCKEKYEATEKEKGVIQSVAKNHPLTPDVPTPLILYREKGCTECNNRGFKGRIGIFEALLIDEAVEEAIIEDPREHVILRAARPQGIPTLAEDGISKVLEGLTSLTELERVVEIGATKPQVQSNEDELFAHHIVSQ